MVIAPLITAGLILSLYSTIGCQFVELDVGFTPTNSAYNNSSEMDFGLYYFYNSETKGPLDNPFGILRHCVPYSDTFETAIVSKDRTWKVARIIALIAVSGSMLSTLAIWMVNLCAVPIRCLWPGILLPATMLSFIAEGSKFLIFDVALCRNAVWFPSGTDSLPETAESCSIGPSSIFAMAAAGCHLLSLLCVCLKTPTTRELDPNYGIASQGVYEASTEREEHYREDEEGDHDEERQLDLDVNDVSSDEEEDVESADLRSETSDTFTSPASSMLKTLDDTLESDDTIQPSVSESRMEVLSRMRLYSGESENRQMIADLVNDLDVSLKHSE